MLLTNTPASNVEHLGCDLPAECLTSQEQPLPCPAVATINHRLAWARPASAGIQEVEDALTRPVGIHPLLTRLLPELKSPLDVKTIGKTHVQQFTGAKLWKAFLFD